MKTPPGRIHAAAPTHRRVSWPSSHGSTRHTQLGCVTQPRWSFNNAPALTVTFSQLSSALPAPLCHPARVCDCMINTYLSVLPTVKSNNIWHLIGPWFAEWMHKHDRSANNIMLYKETACENHPDICPFTKITAHQAWRAFPKYRNELSSSSFEGGRREVNWTSVKMQF